MNRLRTDRLWLVAFLFLAIVGVILVIALQQAAVLSDVRAYTTGEGLYSKAQKRAVIGLLRYARSRSETDYQVFADSIAVPLGDRDARLALRRTPPDLAAAVDGFIRGRNHQEDVHGMATFFVRFHWVSYVAEAIQIWTEADAEISELVKLADGLHRLIGSGQASERDIDAQLASIIALDERLTLLEDRFSDTLGQGARFVMRVTTGALLFITAALIGLGLLFARSMFQQVRRSQLDVLQSELRYRTLSESMVDGILILQQGRFVHANPAGLTLLGYEMHELLGREFGPLIHADFRASVTERHRRRLAGESLEARYDIQVLTRSGGALWVQISSAKIEWDGQPAVLTIMTDITERKRLDSELRRMNEELEAHVSQRTAELSSAIEALERSNIDLQRFAYVASHDLQTPMRSVASFVELLQSSYADKLDERATEWIGRILRSIKHLQNLIRDLLEYSRVDAQPRAFERIAFHEVFEHALSLIDSSVREVGASISCGELPTVTGDRSQLSQLMVNLIGNSIKYRSSEAPRIRLEAELRGSEWCFALRDNGIGIEPRFHERIFEVFQRLHGPQAYPGTGIGLAVCRRVVHRHGGRIWVESPHDGGSIFYFTIPDRTLPPG